MPPPAPSDVYSLPTCGDVIFVCMYVIHVVRIHTSKLRAPPHHHQLLCVYVCVCAHSQCSTVADVKNFTFADGQEHRIAAAYMEFVERKPAVVAPGAKGGPLGELHRRDGFEAASARDIFASTTLAALAAQKSGGI